MWSNLPSHLRTGLGAALLLVVGVAVASFTLSFIALREVASNPLFGWGSNAWIFPACVDMALVASEVVYVSVSMVRGVNPALPFSLMVLFGAATVWFNVERVPAEWRAVTAIPPLAGIFMTILIAYLLKVYARITGRPWHHDAPPPAYGVLGAPGGPIHGAIWRPDVPGYAPPGGWTRAWPYPEMPSSETSANPQNGQGDEAKRAMMRVYLGGLSPDAAGRATGSSIVRAMKAIDVSVSEREARRVLDEYKATQNGRR